MSNYVRGTTVKFEQTFKDEGGDPIVPFNSTYPQLVITDPNGAIAASGVGQQTTTPGNWEWEWSIPAGAELGEWKIGWSMLDLNKESFNVDHCFQISDQIQAQDSLDREGAYLSMCQQSERLIYRSATQPAEINLTIRYAGTDWWTKTKADLTEVYADGQWVYYIDSPKLENRGLYMVLWDVRETVISAKEQSLQHLRVAPDQFWAVLPYLRGLLDKLGKVQNTPLSYTDSELYTYLERGLDLLNGVHPATSIAFGAVPTTLASWWVLLAGWWGLNSFQILNIDVQHNFSGQTVNLDYDHGSPLGEVISRWETMVWEKLPPVKISMYRKAAGPGIVAVRPYRMTLENRVFRAGSSQNALADFPGLVGRIGLFW